MAQRLFGGNVLRGTHHHAGLRDRGGIDSLGDAEVGEFHLAGGRDEDVARFDVAVHQTRRVCDLKRTAGLLQHVQGVAQREAAGAFEYRVQRFSVNQLHDQIGRAALAVDIGLAVVVDAGDPGMVQHRDGAGLGAEPLDEFGVRGELGLEHLHGHLAAQPAVGTLPDLAHTAGRDESLQPVTA
ncbi:Uncharacterised protein [Mycobacteroides abscessus subsp. abscessus]|nr:Uncharacterised protein [Mycobacteroides abscessus subsp. abscessus]SHW52933.1 Uncharacterised protein [Mycobacteroides abscessus subsp. abscessus]SIB17242.1 Uncharacterised protein [Mycobacteroides abscessus subsp. abscessus]SID95370.1 Uncharacterised protein [Mycobacteroides abscessus subsp. abscessus]SKW83764.1 Uncharacterised protein [Mycobacteroides abscessus subsp. abscessus]